MSQQERIRVLHFSNEPVRAGAEEHMLMLLRKLDRSLFRLHLVCMPELLEKFGSDVPEDVDCIPLRFGSPTDIGAAWKFGKTLRERRIDVVHSHMFRASLAASPVAKLCGVPAAIETAHVREHWRKGWVKSSYFIDRLAGRFVSRYIAVSESTGRYLTEEKRLPAAKIANIPNGCDVSRFHPDFEPREGFRAGFGFDPAHRVVVIAARLEPQKGHRVLLDSLPAVVREVPNLRVVCAGEGQLRRDLEEQRDRLGLSGHVHFVGYQADVRHWLAVAEFTVLPSFYEGLPLTAIESLAAGRTVVATAVDGTTEVVIDGRTGLTVPPGNATALGTAILRLLKSPELRDHLASAGRRWVVEHFSQDRQVRQTERVYLDALGAREGIAVPSKVECTDHVSL